VSILNLRLLGQVRVKFLGVAWRIGVVVDQEANSFKLFFVPLLHLMSSVSYIVAAHH